MKVIISKKAFNVRRLSIVCNTRGCLAVNVFGLGLLIDKQPDKIFKAASTAAKFIKYHISKRAGVKLQDIIDAAWSASLNR